MASDPKDLEDAKQWSNRAAEMRLIAEQMSDPTNRLMAGKLATGYDRLAQHAERHAKDAKRQT